jgi:IS605 OrfB family transposase
MYIRSSSVELIATEDQFDLLKEHVEIFHQQGIALSEAMYVMRGEPYFIKTPDGVVEVTLSEIRKKQRSMAKGNRISEVRPLLRAVYEGAVNGENVQSKIMCENTDSGTEKTAGTGNPGYKRHIKKLANGEITLSQFRRDVKADKTIESKLKKLGLSVQQYTSWGKDVARGTLGVDDVYKELQKATTETEKGAKAAIRLREMGIFPIPLPYDIAEKHNRAVFHDVMARLESWAKCDENCRKEAESILEYANKLKKELTPAARRRFTEYVDICREEGLSTSARCIKTIANLIGKNFSQERILREAAKTPYLVEMEVFLQSKFACLRDCLVMAEKWYYAMQRYDRHAKTSLVKPIDWEKSPLRLGFDLSNKSSFALSADGERFFVDLELIVGWVKCKCHRSRYFNTPTCERGSKKFQVNFHRSGERRSGEIKSVGLRYDGKKFFVSLPVNYESLITKELVNQRSYFSSAIGKDDAKTRKRKASVNLGLVATSYDLNASPVLSCATYRLDRKKGDKSIVVEDLGYANFVSHDEIGTIHDEAMYRRVRKDQSSFVSISRLMQMTKKVREKKKISDFVITHLVPHWCSRIITNGYLMQVQNKNKDYTEGLWLAHMIPTEWILLIQEAYENEAYDEKDKNDVRVFLDWFEENRQLTLNIGNPYVEAASLAVGFAVQAARKEQRAVGWAISGGSGPSVIPECAAERFQYLKLKRDYIRIIQAQLRYKRGFGEVDPPNWNAGNLQSCRANFISAKKDYLQKVATEFARFAAGMGTTIVVQEALRLNPDRSRQKRDNDFLSLFSSKTIQDTIEGKLEEYGILVASVEAKNSSQSHHATNALTFRDHRNEIEQNGKGRSYFYQGRRVESVDSDYMASMNLQKRFWTRHADVPTLFVKKIQVDRIRNIRPKPPKSLLNADGHFYITQVDENDLERNKRTSSYLRRTFNAMNVAFVVSGKKVIPVRLTRNQYKRLQQLPGSTEDLVAHKNHWLNREQKMAHVQTLKNVAIKQYREVE